MTKYQMRDDTGFCENFEAESLDDAREIVRQHTIKHCSPELGDDEPYTMDCELSEIVDKDDERACDQVGSDWVTIPENVSVEFTAYNSK